MGCINKNLKDNQRLIQDFSETRVNQLFDEYFQDENPSYSEFISNPNVKEALGIIPISKVKSEIGKAFGKEISSRELKILKKSISNINDKLLGHSYKLFNIKQKGESDNYSWGLRKINSNINIQAKIDRLKQRINTGKQIRNLEDNQFNFPDVNSNLNQGLQWLKEVNPNVQPEIVQGLIDGIANGSYNSNLDLITLSEEFANKKTVKHEFLHKVLASLPFEQRESILNEASKKYGIARGESKTTTKYSQVQQNEINYALKAVDILQSTKGDEVFRKGDKNNWSIDKILQELQIPKDQQDLIKSFNTRNREEIITNLLAGYSFSVEINTATKENDKGIDDEIIEHNGKFMLQTSFDDSGPYHEIFNTKQEAVSYLKKLRRNPTNYYSNLTVPGGTAYQENEISTPLITPSIKGHARFSTDNGLGWFRSDEKGHDKLLDEIEDRKDISYSYWLSQIKGINVYSTEDRIKTMKDETLQKEFKDFIENGAKVDNTKTRRILEVQSDLFQKGRDKESLILNEDEATKKKMWEFKTLLKNRIETLGNFKRLHPEQVEEIKKREKEIEGNKAVIEAFEKPTQNQFLQLLQKNNNWVTFFVKSIIQDSAKKGYEKVLFPSGNTASKIEGHQTLEEFKKQKEDRIKELEKNTIPEWKSKISNINPETYFNMNMFNSKTKEEQQELIKNEEKKLISEIEAFNREINQLKQELERVETEGFGALKPIYNFYENTVTNILNKTYGKENVKLITDEYGNTWNEIDLSSEKVKQQTDKILFQSPKLQYTGDLAIEEKIAEEAENSKDEIVAKTPLQKFIQSIKNLLRNIFKERDKISRLLRDMNQGRLNSNNRNNTNQDIKYQLSKEQSEGIIASEKTIRDLAARMSDRIGIPVRFESDRSKEYKGKLENGTAIVNLAYATLDTPIHEILGHPIIRAIKNKQQEDGKNITKEEFEKETKNNTPSYSSDTISEFIIDNYIYRKVGNEYTKGRDIEKPSELYQNLLKELETGRGKEVLDRVKRDYVKKEKYRSTENLSPLTEAEKALGVKGRMFEIKGSEDYYTLEEQQEEAIVSLISEMIAGKIKETQNTKNLLTLLKKLLQQINDFIRSLLNQKEVEIDKLPDNMTLGDIADLLAYSNSKLILPGYEVEYTTPDNMKFKTYQEASNHISQLAKSVEDVDLDSIIREFPKRLQRLKEVEDQIKDEGIMPNSPLYNELMKELAPTKLLLDFISKNKEYEQSKEIIEEWKRVNNIQYNPEEIYSRGQEFSSVVGAYSSFDVSLMMQNLLQHIEDNEKANNHNKITSKDKIVFGHPTIGKSFLKNQGDNKFISLDDDYSTEINIKVRNIADKYKVTPYQVKDGGNAKWNNDYNTMMQQMFNIAKQKAISENKTLFTSNTNLLKNNIESFDKVINLTDEEFNKRIQERGAKYNVKEWKQQINDVISKIPSNKVILTDKYLSDLFSKGSGFAISAYTKPIDKQIGHLEGGGGKIKFKLYPKSEDILWAANTDVYSGSVWDASEKVNKDKKSELLGVSYTKYPSLNNVNAVQPNLAGIVDDLAHHHNELGIVLTGNNFRLEYDEDIPYQTKKIIDSINKILDQKYGKLVKPEINNATKEKVTKFQVKGEPNIFNTREEAQALANKLSQIDYMSTYVVTTIQVDKTSGIQPTQTNETLKESIDSVKNSLGIGKHIFMPNTTKQEQIKELEDAIRFSEEDISSGRETLESWKKKNGNESLADFKNRILKDIELLKKQKEYTSQALINTKIAALKEVAKKYPRSLIRSEVILSKENKYQVFERNEVLFQKIPNYLSKEQSEAIDNVFDENPELANAIYSALQLKNKFDVILPIGTSGSGKSTFIKSLPQENLVIIEPDAMRVEFTGDMNNKSKDKEIYIEAANRAIKAIKQGKQVVFDTTNLTKDKRLPFIEAIKKAIPTANIQYKLMELNPELAKQRIKAQLARGENRANVSDETIDRHAESYKQMLEDIKNEPISKYKDLGSTQDIEGFKEFVRNKTKGDYETKINKKALNESTDSDVFHYPFDEVYDELDQSEPTGEFEDTFDSEFETNSKKLDKIILNRYLKIQKSLERQKDKLVSEFNKIENTNDFTKDAEIYFDKHKELISEINVVEEKLKRIKAVVDAIFDKKDITSVVIAESNLIIDDINKLLKSENISPAELDYYYNLTKLLEEIHDENLKQEDSSLFTSASSEDLNQLKKLKNTFSNLNNDLLELLRKNINIKNDPIKDAKLFSQWFLKVGDYTNDILKKAESMISKSLFNITKFLNKELELIKELHLKADSDFKRTGKTNNKFDIFFDKNKRIVQVFNYEYTDAAAKLYNAFRFASKDSAKSKRLELIRFHKQHSILLNAKYLFPDIYEHLTGTKVSAEEINKNIALYKSYLDDYTFEKMKSKVYKQTIKYLSKRDNDFFMSNMPFDENSLIQEFLTYIPKDKSNYNDKYSKIVQNDNLRNVYDKFMDLFNELKLISQGTTRSNLNKGFLPFLEKTMIENLSDFSFSTELGKFKQSILSSYDQLKNNSGQTVSNQVENPLKTVNDGLRSFLETKANDYYKQEKINLIYFLTHKKLTTNSAKLITEKFGPGFPSKKAEEIIESWTKEYFTSLEDTQTNDIQVLMNLMAQTVTSYKQKQSIEANLNLIKIAFDNQSVGEFDILGNLVGTNPTKKGRETKLAELLEVTINHFFGKNVQKPQLNDFLKRINNVSVAKQEELNKLIKEINENKELTPNEKIELEKALQNKFKKDSKYVDLDKINDKLLQYLRVLFLGWSPKSAFFNAAMGHIGNYMETIDGRIVDRKDLSAGVKMLFGKEKKKIQKLIANLSLIEDITKDFKKTTEESLHNEKWKNFKPERLQQIVEKSNQSPLIAALLNKSFNGVRIIDMIDESGNFLPQYEEYEYKFVNTAKYLIEKVHGPYDSNRIIMAETTSLGKNVIFMKKWMITSFFMKRFGSFDEKPREDLLMDYQFKGTYITLADVFNTMSNDQSGQRNYLLGIMKTMKAIALSDQSLTEVDKANLRSVRADLLIIGALLIAQQLVKYMLSDDDDDHEGLVFLLNTFFRIETELGSHYFLIDTFEGLAKNTIPQLDVYNRLEKIIKSFDENARISPAIRLAQMVPALNSGVSLYNFFNQQILYNR